MARPSARPAGVELNPQNRYIPSWDWDPFRNFPAITASITPPIGRNLSSGRESAAIYLGLSRRLVHNRSQLHGRPHAQNQRGRGAVSRLKQKARLPPPADREGRRLTVENATNPWFILAFPRFLRILLYIPAVQVFRAFEGRYASLGRPNCKLCSGIFNLGPRRLGKTSDKLAGSILSLSIAPATGAKITNPRTEARDQARPEQLK